MSTHQDKFVIRFPDNKMRDCLCEYSRKSGTSMNSTAVNAISSYLEGHKRISILIDSLVSTLDHSGGYGSSIGEDEKTALRELFLSTSLDSNKPRSPNVWKDLFFQVADALECLASQNPANNQHVLDAAYNSGNASIAAIQYALLSSTDDPIAFLRYWLHGEFEDIRREWPDAPHEIFVGTGQLFVASTNEKDHEVGI